MRRRRNWRPEAGENHVLLSSQEGAKIIKNDFGEGKILAHNYNHILGLVRAFEEWDKEFERRKKQELS